MVFPEAERVLFFPEAQSDELLSDTEWALRYGQFHEAGLRLRTMVFTPAEDGLICVPVLLAGIGPGSALAAGAVFGLLHVARFTYIECIVKGTWYALICLLILPFGILTVVAGHFATDVVVWGALKSVMWILKRKTQNG